MLFVFQVDTGKMTTFDMSLAVESVQNLKVHIERICKIPVDQQVLLISGGEHLCPERRVGSYAAGTDTNPIYLFSKAIVSQQLAEEEKYYGPACDMTERVREASELPACYNTVVKRTKLSQQFYDLAIEEIRFLESLVSEQHLQHQGWLAVVANLEDLAIDLNKRWEIFKCEFNKFMTRRNSYIEFLKNFKDDLVLLQKIPILPALIETQKTLVPDDSNFDGKQTDCSNSGGGGDGGDSKITLYDWISRNGDFMDQLFQHCSQGFSQHDERVHNILEAEVRQALENSDCKDMKEIKGLGERLFGLETLMKDLKSIVQEQMNLAQSFLRNQNRASNLREASIMPDLCATHQQQLNVLLDNHNKIRSIAYRIVAAKNELNANLYCRLQWIVLMENDILELDNKLVFHFKTLSSIQDHFDVLRQVHLAPATYLAAIAEVVRRRTFSQSFLMWASELACHMLTIHNDELTRRKEFQAQFEEHFLNGLFPGMDDLPPSFATEAPSVFDSKLPVLTFNDIECLKRELPELADNLKVPDTTSVTNFFLSRSVLKDDERNDNDKPMDEKIIEVVKEAGVASNLDQTVLKAIDNEPTITTTSHGLAHLRDLDKGCESETDTEEFEKVSQSPFELHFDKGIPSPRPTGGNQDVSTLTEDNLQISRSEYERLRTNLIRLSQLARQAHNELKNEMNTIRDSLIKEKFILTENCNQLLILFNKFQIDRDNKEREIVQRLTVDHELEISDFRKIGQSKNEEIKRLENCNRELRKQIEKIAEEHSQIRQQLDDIIEENRKEIDDLKQQIINEQLDKEKQIKEITDRLKNEHRGEIENIRSRFRLMTMERSPSENSLEKIERGDFNSLTTNPTEQLLIQMTENFESEKEIAVSDAINKENEKWQQYFDKTVNDMKQKFQLEKEQLIIDVSRRISDDKDKQIDLLREQMRNLSLECIKYKSTVQQLAEHTEESLNIELSQRIENLEQRNATLEAELVKYQNRKSPDMAASVAVCEGKVDAVTSPIRVKRRSDPSKFEKFTFQSCRQGDLVLVVWDIIYKNFKILQDGSSMHFLHSDSLESLGLELNDNQPNRTYCFAEVVEKEYCHARKSVNRFNVPKGTKFFRVRVKPASIREPTVFVHQSSISYEKPPQSPLIQQHQQQQTMTQSETTSTTITDIADESSQSLPSSPTKIQLSIELENKKEMDDGSDKCIPEETGDDSIQENLNISQQEDIEKGTELTENFQIQTSIDR